MPKAAKEGGIVLKRVTSLLSVTLIVLNLVSCATLERDPGWGIIDVATGRMAELPGTTPWSHGKLLHDDAENGTFTVFAILPRLLYQLQTYSSTGTLLEATPAKRIPSDVYYRSAVSPDGGQLVYHRIDTDAITKLHLLEMEESILIPNVGWAYPIQMGFVTQNEVLCLFDSHREGPLADAIVRVRLPENEVEILHRVTALRDYNNGDWRPVLSPDRKRLAFVDGETLDAHVKVLDLGTRAVSDLGPASSDPAWAPDGKRLAYIGRKGNVLVHDFRDGSTETAIVTRGACATLRFIDDDRIGYTVDAGWYSNAQFIIYNVRKGRQEARFRKAHWTWTTLWRIDGRKKILCAWE